MGVIVFIILIAIICIAMVQTSPVAKAKRQERQASGNTGFMENLAIIAAAKAKEIDDKVAKAAEEIKKRRGY